MKNSRRHRRPGPKFSQPAIYFIFSALLLLTGCASERAIKPEKPSPKPLALIGYTIQVGAFANISNAVRLTDNLRQHGLNAYHFLHHSGLYKVRFGNYESKHDARRRAESLKINGVIEVYYIVGPDEYAAIRDRRYGRSNVRDHILITAKQYIGIPYRWGGESAETGFDCSGYSMVVYQLNGFDLPRSSRQQWETGRPIARGQLLEGDLVFFATSGGKKVSHVGIYIGDDKFLHAPGRGRKIRIATLTDSYFKARYLGARSYL